MKPGQELYMRNRVTEWSSIRLGGFEGLFKFDPTLGAGFIPVFDSLEAFSDAYPDEEPEIIHLAIQEES